MFKKILVFCLLAIGLMHISFEQRCAVAEGALELGVLDFPPFYVIESDNTLSGIKIEMLRMILGDAGIAVTEAGYPPKRLYKNIATGKTNIFMGIKGVPVYDEHVLYSEKPTDSIEIRVYTRTDFAKLKEAGKI